MLKRLHSKELETIFGGQNSATGDGGGSTKVTYGGGVSINVCVGVPKAVEKASPVTGQACINGNVKVETTQTGAQVQTGVILNAVQVIQSLPLPLLPYPR